MNVNSWEAIGQLQAGTADRRRLAAVLLPSQRALIQQETGSVPLAVTVAEERSKKGRRLRVRGPDGRAVRCCKAWRATTAGHAVILARDVGTYWQAVGL